MSPPGPDEQTTRAHRLPGPSEARAREIARAEVLRHQTECPMAVVLETIRGDVQVVRETLAGETAYGRTHAERIGALEAATGKILWVALGAMGSAVLALLGLIGGLVAVYVQSGGGQ